MTQYDSKSGHIRNEWNIVAGECLHLVHVGSMFQNTLDNLVIEICRQWKTFLTKIAGDHA